MRSWVVKSGTFVLFAAVLAGCGGSSSPAPVKVAQVRLSPDTLSIVAGDVAGIVPTAVNSSGGNVTTTFTFNSSNTALVTIAPSGLVCAGVWDSNFITCKGTDSGGNPLAGTATITATAEGVSSAPVRVAVHPSVTSITVDPVAGCFSVKQTHTFVAHAFHNATDITSLVGDFTWTASAAGVASIDANGVATIQGPGLTGVIATLGSTTSPATFFKGCLPVQIRLHVNLDTATSATINAADTKVIQVDMVDENNVTTASAPVNIVSNNPQVASVSGTTLTGVAPGGAGLLAVCAAPSCGAGLNLPIYSNLFQVTVSGSSPATNVFATTSFAPPSGTMPTMIPIDTSKTPPVAGTAINLPGVPNSLVFAPNGSKAFMGTSAGLASLAPGTSTVTLVDPFVGKVLAVSPDGNTVIESNAANDPGTGLPIEPDPGKQRVVVVSGSASTNLILSGAVAASFTGDGFKAFIAANNGNVYIISPQLSTQTINIGGANKDVATLSSGPFVFVANSAGLEVVGTCNNVQQPTNPPTNSSTIQLVRSIPNADVFVAVDSSGVNVETATVTSLTPPVSISAANCTPNVSYSNQFIDFGIGPFTARQLLVPSNGLGSTNGSHVVVLPVGINKLFVAVPGNPGADLITLSGSATEPLSGGLTLDGNTAWIGVAGSNTVDRVDLTTNSDNLQIATSFKKSDNSAAPPNIVAVQPK